MADQFAWDKTITNPTHSTHTHTPTLSVRPKAPRVRPSGQCMCHSSEMFRPPWSRPVRLTAICQLTDSGSLAAGANGRARQQATTNGINGTTRGSGESENTAAARTGHDTVSQCKHALSFRAGSNAARPSVRAATDGEALLESVIAIRNFGACADAVQQNHRRCVSSWRVRFPLFGLRVGFGIFFFFFRFFRNWMKHESPCIISSFVINVVCS